MSPRERDPLKVYLSEGEKHQDEQRAINDALSQILKKARTPTILYSPTFPSLPDPEIPPLPTSTSLTWEQRKVEEIRVLLTPPPSEPRPISTDSLRGAIGRLPTTLAPDAFGERPKYEPYQRKVIGIEDMEWSDGVKYPSALDILKDPIKAAKNMSIAKNRWKGLIRAIDEMNRVDDTEDEK